MKNNNVTIIGMPRTGTQLSYKVLEEYFEKSSEKKH